MISLPVRADTCESSRQVPGIFGSRSTSAVEDLKSVVVSSRDVLQKVKTVSAQALFRSTDDCGLLANAFPNIERLVANNHFNITRCCGAKQSQPLVDCDSNQRVIEAKIDLRRPPPAERRISANTMVTKTSRFCKERWPFWKV
ncbi:hypothetical protein BC830DRAFT_1220267 [Chytriomyces sp. MP71]|nr:hypothetical protein BC830DRAFT_1220267 [Chytriomyces sp. MP71]